MGLRWLVADAGASMEDEMMTPRAMKVLLSAVAIGVVLLGYVQTSTAALLRWNLQNVTFTDGGAATGFFLVDTQTVGGPFADFDVKLTGGAFPAFEYTPQNSSGGHSGFPLTGATPGAAFETPTRQLYLRPSFGIDGFTKNGTHRLYSASDGSSDFFFNLDSLSYEFGQDPLVGGYPRWVRKGSVTTGIPKPEAWVRWTLDGVKFDNGGTATGSFVYDASTGTVLDFDFHPSGLCGILDCPNGVAEDINPSFGSRAWVSPEPSTGTLNFSFGKAGRPDNPAARLNLLTGEPLTDSGGTVPLSVGHAEETCCGPKLTGSWADACCYAQVHSILITGALIGTPVPEPSEALLLALGIAALVGFSARRRGTTS
jgi:hypothetical protein